ncbi:MAG: GNAT family N-acetyltransferase [Actinomycetota bacterium]|nr:GNAT family N-acetyltransferase [Actinomycetota bacterium]
MTAVTIRDLAPRDAEACDAIILSLPYHFGQESGRRDCAVAVREQPGLVAVENDDVIGFLTFARWFDNSSEITWMGVYRDRRRQGIGGALVQEVARRLAAEGRTLLVVLTVSPSDTDPEPPDGYRSTRAFYTKEGFELARDLAGLWDGDLPVLMVKHLSSNSGSR